MLSPSSVTPVGRAVPGDRSAARPGLRDAAYGEVFSPLKCCANICCASTSLSGTLEISDSDRTCPPAVRHLVWCNNPRAVRFRRARSAVHLPPVNPDATWVTVL